MAKHAYLITVSASDDKGFSIGTSRLGDKDTVKTKVHTNLTLRQARRVMLVIDRNYTYRTTIVMPAANPYPIMVFVPNE